MRVLVVDDEPAVRRAESRVLEALGYQTVAAGSVAEALEVLSKTEVDLALLDVRMPGADGLMLAKSLQADYPDVAVIMVTGTADFTSVNDARRAGALDYLMKPVSPAALGEAVERAMSHRRRRPGRAALPDYDLRPTEPAPVRAPAAAVAAPTVVTTLAAPLAPPPPRVRPITAITPSAPPASPSHEPPIDRLFRAMVELGASDLHLSTGMPPMVRKDGEMVRLDRSATPLSASDVVALVNPIIPGKSRKDYEERHDADFAYEIDGLARFRGNLFMDRRGMGAVFRTVPTVIVPVEQLGLSQAVLDLCALKKGLVLVTGPTGSGKSTTLAAMIDYVNRTRSDHIVTIEDPIEFVHTNNRCLINQREVHGHTKSYKAALRAALREDPDVVLIGEMRDLETISIALRTAETGHLVFGTLHTTTAASTVDRIIEQFPAGRQAQIRVMLSESLRGVIAQTLCRRVNGGRTAALEILLVTQGIANLIREGKTFQIPSLMQVGRSAGMVTLNDALFDLVKKGIVAVDEAQARALDKPAFAAMLVRGSAASKE